MYNYVKNDSRQQIEIMRRCTATALHDVFDFTEDLDDTFKILFFHATGNRIAFLMSFLGCSLLTYRNAAGFCVLTVSCYLLNSLTS